MKLLDCTLRDGGYYTNWSFDDNFVKRFIKSLDKTFNHASEIDWSTEYLDKILSVKLVNGINGAIEHIQTYSSGHTDCIITDTWFSMGQKILESKRKLLKPFQVNNKLLSISKKKSIFMHCLPAHRGEEIDINILEHSKSVVWDEAENRLHTQKAILNWCLKK